MYHVHDAVKPEMQQLHPPLIVNCSPATTFKNTKPLLEESDIGTFTGAASQG